MRALMLLALPALVLAGCGDRPAAAPEAAVDAVPAETARSALTFGDDGLPTFKAGLWEVSQRDGGEVETWRQCIDTGLDPETRASLSAAAEAGCTKTVDRVAGGLVVAAQCEQGGVKIDSRITMRGSQTHQVMEFRMKTDPGQGAPTETVMTAESRWVGDCPAGVQPGERVEG